MTSTMLSRWSLLWLVLAVVPNAWALDTVLHLRTDCTGMPSGTCFTSTQALTDKLWDPNERDPATPTVVYVGAGTFGKFDCPDGGIYSNGHVSLIGMGADKSVFSQDQPASPIISAANCDQLEFQDLSLRSSPGDSSKGVQWNGRGFSRWVNVLINTNGVAWTDTCELDDAPAHYWFNSRMQSRLQQAGNKDLATYNAFCGEHWFYGSDIALEITSATAANGVGAVWADTLDPMNLGQQGDIRLFGSTVRVFINETLGGNSYQPREIQKVRYVSGLYAADGGLIHMHGGIVSMDASTAANPYEVMGIVTARGSFVHTPGTAFDLKSMQNEPVRHTWIDPATDIVRSPYTWPASTLPPDLVADPEFTAMGDDYFVEIDCDTAGNCDNVALVNQRPHLMVFTTNCTVDGPWFDVATNRCRGDTQ